MSVSAAIKIGRIFGIPIYLHITFLLILPLFVYVFSSPPGETEIFGIPLTFKNLDANLLIKYSFGTMAAILFFVTILGHELAHSYLAQKYGVRIKSITLMIFGGVASMEAVPRQPGQEWRMAFAGPATSLAMGAASFAAMLGMDTLNSGSAMISGIVILLGILGFYNILLAGFNLIPAFPMDGGRLLRAFFASRMPYLEATKRAAKIGRYFAIGMGVVGIFTNFWLILIALFVYIGATEEEQATTISETLHGMTVRQLMTDAVQVIHPDTSVVQLQDLILMTKHKGFPVVDKGLVGIVTQVDTNKVPREQLQFARVSDIMTRDVVTVPPEMDAARALTVLTEKRIGRLPVVDGDRLVGIVTKTDFLRAVEVMTARREMALWVQQYPPRPPQPPAPPSPPIASS